jgi:hypothetical protein
MTVRNTRRIGDTERTRSATFLFNHFTADDAAGAVRVWEELAGWYTAKAGVDNSTLLQPTSEAPYALVNYVRLPHGATRFLLAQFSRSSFYTYVRRRLRDHGMVALPILPVQTRLTDHGKAVPHAWVPVLLPGALDPRRLGTCPVSLHPGDRTIQAPGPRSQDLWIGVSCDLLTTS